MTVSRYDSGRNCARALIFTGGRLGQWAISRVREDDYLIGADRGAFFLIAAGYRPMLSLGDFDSVDPYEMQMITDNSEELLACDAVDKDWSDTELALREAIRRGFRDIAIVGALGTRFDHSLANVHLLRQAQSHGCQLTLMDERNTITLCDSVLQLSRDDEYPYVSVLPLTLEAAGVTLEGFRYPLRKATLKLGWSLGVSNVLEADIGTIAVDAGLLLVIQSRD